MVHVIGRTRDVERHQRRPGHEAFDDTHAHWSLERNGAWIERAVERNEVFLQISTSAPGSVLAWEIERLRCAGYVSIGPLWVPAAWSSDKDSYRKVVKLAAEHVLELDRQIDFACEPVYVPKARDELEPLLELWPSVVAWPTSDAFTPRELILWRAFPVHPLGVVAAPAWTDGKLRSPAEFFFHDLDHARFKIREDLLALGVAIPDAYRDGSTMDSTTGEHRSILHAAVGGVGAELWRAAESRSVLARTLLKELASIPDLDLAHAGELLLFEIVHEKSHPLVKAILVRELATSAHVDKLRDKHERAFFGPCEPADSVVARLEDARTWLESRIERMP